MLRAIRKYLRRGGARLNGRDEPSVPPEFEAQRRILAAAGISEPVIFDVGGHLGETVERYRSVFPGSTIYSFEAFPETARQLAARFADDPRVRVVPMAVSDQPGRKAFFVNAFDATNSLLRRPSKGPRYYPADAGPVCEIEVPVTTIDRFLTHEGPARMDILKMDIQGGELMALQGALATLRSRPVPIIYAEAMFVQLYEDNPLFHELWRFLDDLDYSLVNLFDLHVAENGQLIYGDALFVSRMVRSKVLD